jgi:hypothetical protein
MRLRTLARSAIVFVPLLLICAGRLHAHRSASPDRMTQELNRCLTLMRVAAARRKTGAETRGGVTVAVRTDSTAAWTPRTERSERSA